MRFGHCVPEHMSTRKNLPYYSIHSSITPEQYGASLPKDGNLNFFNRASRTVSDRPSDSRSDRGVLLTQKLSPISSDLLSESRVTFAPSTKCIEI
jgi:hypothetical protein